MVNIQVVIRAGREFKTNGKTKCLELRTTCTQFWHNQPRPIMRPDYWENKFVSSV